MQAPRVTRHVTARGVRRFAFFLTSPADLAVAVLQAHVPRLPPYAGFSPR
jgi:hypothetical protein